MLHERGLDSLQGVHRVHYRNGFPSFSDEEITGRHRNLRRLMEQENIAALAAFGSGRFSPEIQFLSNWPGGREGYFLLPLQGDPTLLVQFFNHVPLATRLSSVADTRWAGEDSIRTVAASIRQGRASLERIGLIGPWRFQDRDRLASLLPEVQLVDFTTQYRQLRLIRSEEELAFFAVAAELTDRSMEALEASLRPGLREYELAAIVEETYARAGGYAGIHFISSTPMRDPQTSVPHQYQSDRVVQAGDVVITEISGSYWGYASQIHRTYIVGVQPTSEWTEMHEVAVEAFDAIFSVLKDGASTSDVLDAAEVIHERGYTILDDLLHGADQYPPILRTRRTSHGNPERFHFRENMVVTIQPHVVTLDRRMGLQFGETVRVTRDGAQSLHRYKREVVTVSG